MRLRILLPALALFAVSLPAQAQQPGPGTPGALVVPDPNQLVGPITAPDADIDTVIGLLKMLTNRDVVRPATLPQANLTYNVELKQMPRADALALILSVLKLNGIGVVELGDRALLVNALTVIAREAPEIIEGSTLGLPASGKIATKIFKLNFIAANQFFGGIAGTLLSAGTGGSPAVQILSANGAIVTDTVANLQRVEKLIQQFDSPNTNVNSKSYTLTSGTAQTVLTTLNQAIAPMRTAGQLGVNTTVTADARTNQIIVIGSPDIFPFFDSLIAKLDIRADPNTVSEVILLKHALAADVSTMLGALITGQTAAITRANAARPTAGAGGANGPGGNGLNGQQGVIGPGGIAQPNVGLAPGAIAIAPGAPAGQPPIVNNIVNNAALPAGTADLAANAVFSQSLALASDARINAIIVSGTASDVALIKKILSQIDVVLPQVRIEAVAVEITLANQDASGLSALGFSVAGDKLVGFTATGAGTNGGSSVTITNGTITRPGTNSLASYDLAADIALAATPRKTNSTIISQPAIVTTHAKPATFFSGETRPVVNGSTTVNGQVTSTTTQLDIGTTLNITPLIGIDGSVELQIEQQISDVSGTVQIDANQQYIISTKRTNAYVTAKSGEIIVLGGFQKLVDSKNTSRLGPIPIIGDLFGARSTEKRRQEIIFFLRPTILTNTAVDNQPALNKVDTLPQRDLIRKQLDPTYVAPKSTILDRILP